MPKVSVMVPNYNHAKYLNLRIDSILNQTFQDFELILLDDCSTDNSRDILLKYENHPKVSHILFNEQNSGSTFKQWKKGIELAKGEYIWIAESDDWADKMFLEIIVSEFENRSNVGLIYSASRLIDSSGEIIFENNQTDTDSYIEYSGNNFILQKLSLKNSIWNASMMMFRRSIYPEAENQDLYTEMKYCGDWLFYILLAQKSDVLEIKKVLNNFRVHTQNVSGNAENSALTFIEGIYVYLHIKKIKSFFQQFSYAVDWIKNYNRNRIKKNYSKAIRKNVLKKMRQEAIELYCINFLISPVYSLKKKIREYGTCDDINAGL